MDKPRQSLRGLINISFGFFGIQVGFALQNANMSRVFQSLGASIDQLPALWVAAPLTGLIVQPIIGHLSDRTWLGRLGRRRPYFVMGAGLAASALVVMPLAPALLAAALLLWLLDASLNISMEPFRAFVGDMLGKQQHAAGYAIQTAFIGAGSVVGSLMPWLLTQAGVSNQAAAGAIPATVRASFWIGAVALVVAVGWTVLSTREFSPEEMAGFAGDEGDHGQDTGTALAARQPATATPWLLAGMAISAAAWHWALAKEIYLLGGLLAAYGLAVLVAIGLARSGRKNSLLASIVGDFAGMPPLMKRLAVVQFFTWSALYIMWTNTTPVVAQYVFHATDPASAAYNDGANWVDILFASYNAVATLAALLLLPAMARAMGQMRTHALCLLAGAAGFAGFLFIRNAHALLLCEGGIGIAWASILAMPYAILASHLPQGKLGIYMGLFNVFVVLPQLLVATVMGSIMRGFFPGQPVWTLGFAAGALTVAALCVPRTTPA